MINEVSSHRQEYLDAIVKAINESVESQWEYEKDHPLCDDAHFYMFESKRSVKDFSCLLDERHSEELAAHVKKALSLNVSEELIIEALKESVNIEYGGIYIPNNAVESWHNGESEYQFEELNNEDLTLDERDYIAKNLDCYWDKKSDCVYVDRSYDVIWMTCSVLKFKRNLGNLVRGDK
jgi:hypothetical protein